MRIIQTALLAGVAAVGCLGVAALAGSPPTKPQASQPQFHVLTVRLPDGSVEQIGYSGDVAPRVVLAPGGLPFAAFAPMAGFGPAADPGAAASDPFAMLERLSAQMDRQMAEMMRNAPLAPPAVAAPGGMQQTALGKLPAGSESYSFVSSISGGKACTRSVEITSQGSGQPPRVVSQTSGDCGGRNAAAAPPAAAAATVHEPSAGKVVA
ncbi:MAG TPA: hypothetical protein VHZ26_05740 [Caulobacteraceae bacterium]|jgi:hypothetical protein|nr:hypothetical protein [Caulobacteraceae bacterium]